jgi:predicted transglutaminase-like cysteine proteinase
VGFARLLAGVQLLFVALFTLPTGAVAAPPHVFPAVFASREVFSANIDLFPNWTGVLQRARAEIAGGASCSNSASPACPPAEWQDILHHAAGLGLRAKVDYVNTRINAHPYVASVRNWGTVSYWETPFEFLRRNGQCQDYATTKFMLLRAAGVSNDLMRIVVTHDFVSRQDHAVLLVEVDGEALVLDNLARDVVPATKVYRYQPYYSINEAGWWRHLPPATPAAMAALRPATAGRTEG